jgi:hypothetical protein
MSAAFSVTTRKDLFFLDGFVAHPGHWQLFNQNCYRHRSRANPNPLRHRKALLRRTIGRIRPGNERFPPHRARACL